MPKPTAIGSMLLLLDVVALAVRPGVVTCVNRELQLLLVAAAAGPIVDSGEDGEGVRGCAPAPDPALVSTAAPVATASDIGGGLAAWPGRAPGSGGERGVEERWWGRRWLAPPTAAGLG